MFTEKLQSIKQVTQKLVFIIWGLLMI